MAYLYDGVEIKAEYNSSDTLVAGYVHGPGIDELLATRDHAAGKTLYHLTDSLGSTVALVDAAQVIQASFSYSSFGGLRGKSGAADTRFRFTGREADAESGLMHYRARAYDPSAGRFLQPDPWPRTPADPRIMGMNYAARLSSVMHPMPGAAPGFLQAPLDLKGLPTP